MCLADSKKQFHSESNGYSITIPDGWIKIPDEIVAERFNQTFSAKVKPSFGYEMVFQQSASGQWFEYPYLLVQVMIYSDIGLNRQMHQSEFTIFVKNLTVPEGNFFYISALVKAEVAFDDALKKIEHYLQSLRSPTAELPQPAFVGPQLSYQLTNLTDPAIVKAQAPPNVSDAMIEGNIGLQWAMHDFRYGSGRKSLARKLAKVTQSQVHNVAHKYLNADKCSICTLRPDMKVTP